MRNLRPQQARWFVAIGVALVLAGGAAGYWFNGPGHSSALWTIVHTQCVPNQNKSFDPRPCAMVDVTRGEQFGYAVLKDLVGVAQYLLIPTRRVSGIESPELLAADSPNWFALAWQVRHFVENRLSTVLRRDDFGLAINSEKARSQDQLHIHLDCLRPDVRQQLVSLAGTLPEGWAPDSVDVVGAPYRVFKSSQPDATLFNPFRLVADGISGARDHMGDMTIVMVGVSAAPDKEGFLVLAGQHDSARGIRGHGEDMLDHSCAIAK